MLTASERQVGQRILAARQWSVRFLAVCCLIRDWVGNRLETSTALICEHFHTSTGNCPGSGTPASTASAERDRTDGFPALNIRRDAV
jgi:hypothetical protein